MNREEKIFFQLNEYKNGFDPIFLKSIPKEPRSIYKIVEYHFNTGGKRWRPFLIRTICKTLGGTKEQSLPLEIALEYIHNWSLIHDDIEDAGEMRRGKDTVWKAFGLARAVNVGDAMGALEIEVLSLGQKVWGEKNLNEMYKIMGEAIRKMCEGQNAEFDMREKKGNVEEKEVLEMMKKKTGALIKFSLVGIAKAMNASPEIIRGLEEYAIKLPIAFQIQDDQLNLIGKEEYGKEIGGDIREGKRTIQLTHCIKNCNEKDRKKIISIILKPGEKKTEKEIEFVIEKIKETKSLDYALEFSRKLATEAAEALNVLPDREERKVMQDIALWLAVDRKF